MAISDTNADNCLDLVTIVASDPDNNAAAQQAGGVLAAAAVAAPAIASPSITLFNAPALAMGIHEAYNYGSELGPHVMLPLEALATFANCDPTAALDFALSYAHEQYDALVSSLHESINNNSPTSPDEAGSSSNSGHNSDSSVSD